MYKEDLALNNLQCLVSHKKSNQASNQANNQSTRFSNPQILTCICFNIFCTKFSNTYTAFSLNR